jgi:hypothetical protein
MTTLAIANAPIGSTITQNPRLFWETLRQQLPRSMGFTVDTAVLQADFGGAAFGFVTSEGKYIRFKFSPYQETYQSLAHKILLLY